MSIYVVLRQTTQNLHNYRVYINSTRGRTIGTFSEAPISWDAFLDSEFNNSSYKFYDPMGFFNINTNQSRFTVPVGGAGLYKLQWSGRQGDGGAVFAGIWQKNGVSVNSTFWGADPGGRLSAMCYAISNAVAGDFFDARAYRKCYS